MDIQDLPMLEEWLNLLRDGKIISVAEKIAKMEAILEDLELDMALEYEKVDREGE